VRPDGTFTVSGLAPGTYTLRTQRMGPPVDGPEIAMATVTVAGDDITDVQLVATKPSTLTGRIIVDPAAASLLPRTLTIGAFPASFTGMPMPSPPPARMADDYTFELKSPPGVMRLSLSSGFGPQATGWSIRSVRVNGVDVTDAGIEFKPNEDITGVEVELTQVASGGVKLECVNGGIKLRLPSEAAATISASVANGGIDADGLKLETTDSSRRSLEARLNGGGPMIKIEGTNGGIKLAAR